MIDILDKLPSFFLTTPAHKIFKVFPKPTLIHLKGEKDPPVFISLLLHGNEDTGLSAIQWILREYQDKRLPRSLSLFIGNIWAAKEKVRRLPHQVDYNRIWNPGPLPENKMACKVIEIMKKRGVFASVDIHNNTGFNPHYACVNYLNYSCVYLASQFSHTVVYFIQPKGVLSMAFGEFCPSVTIECGRVGDTHGLSHSVGFIEKVIKLEEISYNRHYLKDIALYHTHCQIKTPRFSFGFGKEKADIVFEDNLDHLNFIELPKGTFLGKFHPSIKKPLTVIRDKDGAEDDRFFLFENGEIRTKIAFMPSMFTLDKKTIEQDCFGYINEKISGLEELIEKPTLSFCATITESTK